MRLLPFALCTTFVACASGETIRVREREEVLFSGRMRVIENLKASEHRSIGIGGEVGAYGTNGDYASINGNKNYRVAVGYAAFVADIGIGPFRILPKIGVGLGDFAVAGQTTKIREDGLGAILGLEGRYRFAKPFDVFARAMSFQRSSLDASMVEFGIGYHPTEYVAFELGYGIAGNVVDEATDLFNTTNGADVETQGLLASISLQF